jgi:hypothetical protein
MYRIRPLSLIVNFTCLRGIPYYLTQALRSHGAKNLTILANIVDGAYLALDYDD